jgi:UDP:flavonoid glycosyltransferase YjiC (YdhE family)
VARIVFATYGSLGDLHPFLALALEMKRRGRDCVVATSACYREKVGQLGLSFTPLRPDSTFVRDPALMKRYMHSRWGLVRVGIEVVGPAIRQTYEDLNNIARQDDIIVCHNLAAYSTRLLAEKRSIRWISTLITPLGILSPYDLPIIPVSPGLSAALRWMGPMVARPLLAINKRATRFLARPWYELRDELGLPASTDANPLLDTHSPTLELALFSQHFAQRQRDWPNQSKITGFPHYDGAANRPMPDNLIRFLEAGDPPLVFTRGDSAADVAGTFFRESLSAAEQLHRRCVLVTGRGTSANAGPLPASAISVDYAPFSQLFARASVIVHAGGIGATGFALASGRPTLVVPQSMDHFDNAARAVRLGIARTINIRRYTAKRAVEELSRLLDEPSCARQAAQIGLQVQAENGAARACDAIELAFGS